MKKREKARAALNLIDSLLDQSDEAHSSGSDASDAFSSSDDSLGAKRELRDSGLTPTLLLTADDESTSHLSVDAPSGFMVPDPVTVAARTHLALLKSKQEVRQAKPKFRMPEEKKQAVIEQPANDDYAVVIEQSGDESTLRINNINNFNNNNNVNGPDLSPDLNVDLSTDLNIDVNQAIHPYRPTAFNQNNFPGSDPALSPAYLHQPSHSAPPENSLRQSEHLRIAQEKINNLERDLEDLRRENEKLASAGDVFRRRADELTSKSENLDAHAREAQHIFDEEKRILRSQMSQKEREAAELRQRVDEMETRLESNFKKIRVRERDLEHRLEIVKLETASLVNSKDNMILDLKRQIDQLGHESEFAKQKSQELFKQYKDKQETIRRVVRALRIALTILEGDDDAVPPVQKPE
jgi:hypothetical protein